MCLCSCTPCEGIHAQVTSHGVGWGGWGGVGWGGVGVGGAPSPPTCAAERGREIEREKQRVSRHQTWRKLPAVRCDTLTSRNERPKGAELAAVGGVYHTTVLLTCAQDGSCTDVGPVGRFPPPWAACLRPQTGAFLALASKPTSL